jgi:hypothetical protein
MLHSCNIVKNTASIYASQTLFPLKTLVIINSTSFQPYDITFGFLFPVHVLCFLHSLTLLLFVVFIFLPTYQILSLQISSDMDDYFQCWRRFLWRRKARQDFAATGRPLLHRPLPLWRVLLLYPRPKELRGEEANEAVVLSLSIPRLCFSFSSSGLYEATSGRVRQPEVACFQLRRRPRKIKAACRFHPSYPPPCPPPGFGGLDELSPMPTEK